MKTLVYNIFGKIGAVLAAPVFFACTQSPTLVTGVREQKAASSISFGDVKAQVFQPQCVRCHSQYGDYASVFNEKTQILDAVESGRMPKGGARLANSDLQLLREWISAGAPESATSSEPVPEPLVATYDSISKQIFIPRCVICHRPDGQARFLDLSTHAAILKDRQRDFGGELLYRPDDPESSYLIQVIKDPVEPMPPIWSKIPKLTEEQIEVLKLWIAAGLP